MSLLNQYVLNHGQLGPFFDRIREAQAPAKFSQQFLKDIGFNSSNYRAFIPLFKGLGFLTDDGTPKSEYMLLLDATQWKTAIAEALKRSYSDIFILKTKPTKNDKATIIGKYKTTYNVNELSAERAANTFLALLDLADEAVLYGSKPTSVSSPEPKSSQQVPETPDNTAQIGNGQQTLPRGRNGSLELCYNIQIHLPPTKDIEVYNSIFRSLRENFLD